MVVFMPRSPANHPGNEFLWNHRETSGMGTDPSLYRLTVFTESCRKNPQGEQDVVVAGRTVYLLHEETNEISKCKPRDHEGRPAPGTVPAHPPPEVHKGPEELKAGPDVHDVPDRRGGEAFGARHLSRLRPRNGMPSELSLFLPKLLPHSHPDADSTTSVKHQADRKRKKKFSRKTDLYGRVL